MPGPPREYTAHGLPFIRREQARWLRERLRRESSFLWALKRRLENWIHKDKTDVTYQTWHRLHLAWHHLSIAERLAGQAGMQPPISCAPEDRWHWEREAELWCGDGI